VECDTCYQKIEDVDLDVEKKVLEHRLGRTATEDELVLYLQHPNDAIDFFKFEAKYGKTWVLPPSIWFRKGGFTLGEKFEVPDVFGRLHTIEIGPQRKTKSGDAATYLIIDHHPEPILTEMDVVGDHVKRKVTLSKKEIDTAAKTGDVRSQIIGTVSEVCVAEGDEVAVGQILLTMEAMKMLNNVISEVNGKVTEVFASAGDKVEVGDPLLSIQKE
jgi:pyruvate carboxylase